jgi:hypothetical protein
MPKKEKEKEEGIMKIKNFSRTIFLKPGSYILISIIVLIFAFLCNSCSTNAIKELSLES